MGGGVMIPTGGPSENAHKLAEFEAPTENVDAFGNVRLTCHLCSASSGLFLAAS